MQVVSSNRVHSTHSFEANKFRIFKPLFLIYQIKYVCRDCRAMQIDWLNQIHINIVHSYNKRELEAVQILWEWSQRVSSRIVNFRRTEASLTVKWGRISPAVYWWYKIQSSYVVRRHSTSRDVAEKLADYPHPHALTIPRMETARCLTIEENKP